MLELFGLMTTVEKFTNPPTATYSNFDANGNLINNAEDFKNKSIFKTYPISWIIVALIISFGTAYLAFSCNDKETSATRFVATLFAFFFSGIYLLYYFIIYILLNKKCNGKDVSDLMKMFK